MRVCPKCGAYYADSSSGFCLVDGTPLVNIDPNSDKWSEGARALKEKDDGLRKQKRKLNWRRVLISTMLVTTFVVCAAAFNRWTRVVRVRTFTISGQVTEAGKPLRDVKITLYGGREEIRSVTDAQGKYAFTKLPAGVSYVITPDPEIRFTEPTKTINLAKDEAADFFVQLYKISGKVTEAGKPLGDVKVTLYRGREEIDWETTDAQGQYAFTELPSGAGYIVSPDPEIRFTEPSHPISSLRQDEEADFFVQLYKISGEVTQAGKPRGDVKITLYRGREEIDRETTDALGKYSFGKKRAGVSYIVTPDPQIRFIEPTKTINLTKDEVANFSVQLYKINGQVTVLLRLANQGTEVSHPLERVTITLQKGTTKLTPKTTNAHGDYDFGYLPAGDTYTVTAARDGLIFEPPKRTFSLTQDTTVNFQAFPIRRGTPTSTPDRGPQPTPGATAIPTLDRNETSKPDPTMKPTPDRTRRREPERKTAPLTRRPDLLNSLDFVLASDSESAPLRFAAQHHSNLKAFSQLKDRRTLCLYKNVPLPR